MTSQVKVLPLQFNYSCKLGLVLLLQNSLKYFEEERDYMTSTFIGIYWWSLPRCMGSIISSAVKVFFLPVWEICSYWDPPISNWSERSKYYNFWPFFALISLLKGDSYILSKLIKDISYSFVKIAIEESYSDARVLYSDRSSSELMLP